jgi:uncharacterized protein
VRRFLPRLAVIGTVWTALHVLMGIRLLGAAGIPGALALAWLPFIGFLAGRRRLRGKRALEWAGYVAMGVSSLLLVAVAFTAILPVRVTGTSVLGGVLGLTALGLVLARRPRVVRVTVPIRDLPADLVGLRIVQLSDLHVGPTIRRRFVEAVVETANALAPDLVAVTGDVADGYVPELREHVAPLARLEAPLGRFFVTGNHEYYWDPQGWTRELERLGFDVLSNEHRLLRRGTGRLLLAGVTDLSARPDPQGAVAGAPECDARILLAHQPRSAYAAHAAGFDLQLSGHTHGGQFFPFNLLVRLFQPFVAGLHKVERMWLYVSRGTGYWGPPLRLGAPAEITLIELARAETSPVPRRSLRPCRRPTSSFATASG